MIRKFFHSLFKIIFFLLFVSFAVGLILLGLYLNKISQKKYVFDSVLNQVGNQLLQYIQTNSPYNLGDDFEIRGTSQMDFSSEKYENNVTNDLEFEKKNQILKNLSMMDVQYQFLQSKTDGKLLFSLDEKTPNKSIFSGKYYIEDATKYYYVDGILDQYVNGGNNNYFEMLNEEYTTEKNLEYLYHFFLQSIENQVLDTDLKGYDTEVNLGDDRVKVGQVSLNINNKYLLKVFKGVLKDINQDKRAKTLIENIYPELLNESILDDFHVLEDDESYTLNIYIRKFLYKPCKLELLYMKGNQKELYTYEGNLESGFFYYSVDNEVQYTADVSFSSKRANFILLNRSGEESGNIKIEKSSNGFLFTLNLALDKDKYDLEYSSIIKDYHKNKSYIRDDHLTFKFVENMVTTLQGNVIMSLDISNDVSFHEDTANSYLESTIGVEAKDKFDHIKDTVKAQLES